ncbi:hypothetical protein U1Q18_044782 [Sarracenia purpurea var. burkii]
MLRACASGRVNLRFELRPSRLKREESVAPTWLARPKDVSLDFKIASAARQPISHANPGYLAGQDFDVCLPAHLQITSYLAGRDQSLFLFQLSSITISDRILSDEDTTRFSRRGGCGGSAHPEREPIMKERSLKMPSSRPLHGSARASSAKVQQTKSDPKPSSPKRPSTNGHKQPSGSAKAPKGSSAGGSKPDKGKGKAKADPEVGNTATQADPPYRDDPSAREQPQLSAAGPSSAAGPLSAAGASSSAGPSSAGGQPSSGGPPSSGGQPASSQSPKSSSGGILSWISGFRKPQPEPDLEAQRMPETQAERDWAGHLEDVRQNNAMQAQWKIDNRYKCGTLAVASCVGLYHVIHGRSSGDAEQAKRRYLQVQYVANR